MPKSAMRWLLGDRDPTEEVYKDNIDPKNNYLRCQVEVCDHEEHARWYCLGHFKAWDADGRPKNWIPHL